MANDNNITRVGNCVVDYRYIAHGKTERMWIVLHNMSCVNVILHSPYSPLQRAPACCIVSDVSEPESHVWTHRHSTRTRPCLSLQACDTVAHGHVPCTFHAFFKLLYSTLMARKQQKSYCSVQTSTNRWAREIEENMVLRYKPRCTSWMFCNTKKWSRYGSYWMIKLVHDFLNYFFLVN